ncbi:hypothetical protein DAD186_06870 [Dermabacter vaginalis]|uniref:Uncharacterized protein n=1 Tax=Dermabacter vaginalis TaxID=1630135 RepID=A0A1B0ZH43_9MICO|nr:hypothetical protein [Dermabacter vaginalis]ANP27237.1 hypothetical protein DAD186_06870 [Dermabacter vaginalis]
MVMHEVKVLVPEDRLADFYTRFGTWLAGSDAAWPKANDNVRKKPATEGGALAETRPAASAPQSPGGERAVNRSMDEAKQASDRTPPVPENPRRSVAAIRPTSSDQDLLDGAIEWWRSLKRNERDIFTLFMDAAPNTLGASEIVAALGLKSERVIPGVLAWPRRKAARAGFPLAWKFEHDADGKAHYGLRNMPEVSMSATEYATLLREAKRKVEG